MISRVRVTPRVPAPHRRRRTRSLTLAAAAAALVGAPLLAGSTASAESAGTVTFSGGCGLLGSGLGANSTPDAAQVSVPAGSGVRFANQLGQPATLRLDGDAAAEVPAGGTADVVFHNGPVSASMEVSCLLGTPAGTVTVEVSQVAAPPPQPGSGGSAAPPSPPSSGTSAGAGTSSQGGSSAGAGAPAGTDSGDQSWAGWWPGVQAPPPAGQPDDAEPQDGRSEPTRGGERHTRWGIEVEPADSGGTSGDPATVDAESASDELAAEQLSRTSGSASEDGPIGLLALIAAVCVVGVSAGAVRALVTQRANRAEWA
jgi:hypothetical protein